MAPLSDKATYINYLSSGSEEDVLMAYGDNYKRLQNLKRKFDPQNIFN